jgi:hypothetical protein
MNADQKPYDRHMSEVKVLVYSLGILIVDTVDFLYNI